MNSKVEIKRLESGGFLIKVDDKEKNGITSGADIHIEATKIPVVNLCIPWQGGEIYLSDAEAANSMGLQVAANIVRSEFTKKGDWYNALVASIYGYLREVDGSIPYDQMAVELANRIVGIEPEADTDTIENLDLTVRTYNRLKHAGINTVSQLRNTYTENLREIANLNQQNINEIAEKLEKYEF